MALTKIRRHRAPNDGSWFQTTANLNSVLRAATHYDDERALWPSWADATWVPIFVRMVKYKAMETPQRPDGMIYGPVVRVGTLDSTDFDMFGNHYAAGLTNDYRLDSEPTDNWIYYPHGYGEETPPGADVSVYRCDKCHNDLFRDDLGRRPDRSACIYDGELVCRDCDVRGIVYDWDVSHRIADCRRIARFVGGIDAERKFEDRLTALEGGFSFNYPAQTRLFLDGDFSFGFSTIIFTDEGKKRGINGGLIQHGPRIVEDDEGWRFTTWDYGQKKERAATQEEISGIHWSIHT